MGAVGTHSSYLIDPSYSYALFTYEIKASGLYLLPIQAFHSPSPVGRRVSFIHKII